MSEPWGSRNLLLPEIQECMSLGGSQAKLGQQWQAPGFHKQQARGFDAKQPITRLATINIQEECPRYAVQRQASQMKAGRQSSIRCFSVAQMAQLLSVPMEASLTSRPSRPPLAQSAPRTCATAIGWPRQLPSQLLLPACVTLAGCVVRARKPLKPVRQSRQTTTSIARAARAVSVVVENSARQELADCDAQWMEKLLQECLI